MDAYFTGLEKYQPKFALKYDFGMPNPRPILIYNSESEYIIDGGDGKYYFWNSLADGVCLINQPDLEQILADPDLCDSTYLGKVWYDAYADDPEFLEELEAISKKNREERIAAEKLEESRKAG